MNPSNPSPSKSAVTPWHIQDAGPRSGNVIRWEIVTRDGTKVCEIEDPTLEGRSVKQVEAWVRSIAAVPEMIEALRRCVASIEHWNPILDKEWQNYDGQLNPALNAARAALNQAEGK